MEYRAALVLLPLGRRRPAASRRTQAPTLPDPALLLPACLYCPAGFLDRIKQAYQRDPSLPNLLVDPAFAQDLADRQAAWRRVVQLAVGAGIAAPGITNSLAYFDTYRRGRLPAGGRHGSA